MTAVLAVVVSGASAETTGVVSPALAVDSTAWRIETVSLEQAAEAIARADLHRAIGHLERIDFAAPSFGEADRAAFLLGHTFLRLGSHARFVALAEQVATWPTVSPYTRWLAQQRMLVEHAGAQSALEAEPWLGLGAELDPALAGLETPDAPLTAAEVLAAGLLLRRGATDAALHVLGRIDDENQRKTVAAYLETLALAAGGGGDRRELEALAALDTTSALGRDLAGAARLRLATRALQRGEDPSALLAGVPATSRHAMRAQHMLALVALERGDEDTALAMLEQLRRRPNYAERREVSMALAGRALEGGQWQNAEALYAQTDADWSGHARSVQDLLNGASFDRLWASWRESSPVALPHAVAPPLPHEWRALASSRTSMREADYDLERVRWQLGAERAQLERRRTYFALGQAHVRAELERLEARSAELDSLQGALALIDAQLEQVRADAVTRIERRVAALLERSAEHRLWSNGMRRFHVEGPNRDRAEVLPENVPSPDRLTRDEIALAQALADFVTRFRAHATDLIAHSYRDAWRPRLIDRVAVLAAAAQQHQAWARRLDASIDSTLGTLESSDRLVALGSRSAALATRADSLRSAHERLRDRVARAALERERTRLAAEREGIDYGLAAAAYGSTLDGSADSALAGPAAGVLDDPQVRARRTEAIERIRGFLAGHPGSFARGEMRFRLADLLLIEARQDFHARMAAYLRAQERGAAAPLPVLSYAPALELYQAILDEDSNFAHRDAALFNAGMILADEGRPEAARYFEDLVTSFPQAPYAQEAYLRLADMQFDAKRYSDCIALYEHAAAGADLNLRTIALYKMGWAHFNEDRFRPAVHAFRAILDLYSSDAGAQIESDLESEAETYLIHSLACAGGAPAFAEFFDGTGSRPYEAELLLSLGQHLRQFSLYAQAIAADELWIARYPLAPDALLCARRMTETYDRWDRAELGRRARLRYAARFAPGSEWLDAQPSDSLRLAGQDFARRQWKFVALHHHRKARKLDGARDWREALRLYETVLATWPDDDEAPALHMFAGEASAHLSLDREALSHYLEAAAQGGDSLAARALWQRVALADVRYEASRAAAATGGDSLARQVLDTGDRLLADVPTHAKANDVVWRQGQLAFAHGWNQRAAADFKRLTDRSDGDPRAPLAASLRGDALFRSDAFDRAGLAYEEALTIARAARHDSIAERVAVAIPISYHRHAEQAVARDSSDHRRHARLFETVAARWPGYPHAHAAQFRAGLAYIEAGQVRQAVLAMTRLIERFPDSEYVQDAHLHIAKTWEADGKSHEAAAAYARFAERYPDDPGAREAMLLAGDLYEAARDLDQADQVRLNYIDRYPADTESAMEILETLARRELARAPSRPLSALLAAAGDGTPSHLSRYLARASAHPELAAPAVLAEVRFRRGEEARDAFAAARLTQPLERSLPLKQARLDSMLSTYRAAVDLGVAKWAHASTFRIGETLIAFGDALVESERPADLGGDDLLAYEDVLLDQAYGFYDQGEHVWSELVKEKGGEQEGEWVRRARELLWERLAKRFYYRPEVEFPLVQAKQPEPVRPEPRLESHASPIATPDDAKREDTER